MKDTWWDVLWTGDAGWVVADHLWQSTVCVALAAIVAWLAGPGRPALRHAIWLGASVKFLIPFSLVVAAGEALAPLFAAVPMRALPAASFQIVGEPFTLWAEARADVAPAPTSVNLVTLLTIAVAVAWAAGAVTLLGLRWTRWRKVSAVVSGSTPLREGREVEAVCRALARRSAGRGMVTIREIAGATPALFGLRRAVLLWPHGLSARLQDDELQAVVAHEVAHFRRRDNLAALVHTVVEAAFWFHPAVWWVSARLVEERERACDHEALDTGVAPEAYAETLLTVCRFGLAQPQPLVASAAGSSLGQRVEAIMDYRPGRVIARQHGMGTALAVVILLLPLAVGIGRAHERGVTGPAENEVPTVPVRLMAPADAVAAVTMDTPSESAVLIPSSRQGRDASWHQGAYRGGGLEAIRIAQPTYSAAALQAGIEGTVTLEALILPNGTVGDVRILKSLDRDFGLDEEAMRAARLSVFRPPVDREGRPVSAVVTLILDFRLDRSPAIETSPDPSAPAQTPASPATPPRDPRPAPPNQEDLEFRQGALGPSTPGLTRAKAIRIVQPRYTSAAMRAKVQGSVEIEIVIGTDGTVQRARVITSLDPDLDQQALNAVRESRFEAAVLDGKPVESWARLTLDFRIY